MSLAFARLHAMLRGAQIEHQLLSIDALIERVKAIQAGAPQRIQIQSVGVSQQGSPIELISIGSGARSALVVAGPHSNEPIGSLTVLTLLGLLSNNSSLLRELDFRWHFVLTIDPDGLRRNDSWVRRPLSLARYFAGFFRPAFIRQPEYTFPFEWGEARFARATPENAAWQTALELTRPSLQLSLHNADFGGVFHLVSEDRPALYSALQRLPELFGLILNPIGEPLAEMSSLARGIFSFPNIRKLVESFEYPNPAIWSAGQSSAEFARRYGTLSITTEVPLWDAALLIDTRPAETSLPAILRGYVSNLDLGNELVAAQMPHLMNLSEAADQPWIEAVQEALIRGQHQYIRLAQMLEQLPPTLLSMSDALLNDVPLQLAAMRPIAMLRNWAVLIASARPSPVAREVANRAGKMLQRQLATLRQRYALRAVPTQRAVAVQAGSALVAAAHFAD